MFGFFKRTQTAAPLAEDSASAAESAQGLNHTDAWQRLSAGRVSDELLRARLAETVVWCDSLESVDDLRSETLNPRLFHDGPDDLVSELGWTRQRELRYRKLQVMYQSPVVATGRFMLYFPDDNLADGYAESVSSGFFDVNNLPACDTWVTFVSDQGDPGQSARRHLLCYVPAPLIDVADLGIEGNPEACIVWLDQSDVSMRARVEALTSRVPLRTHTP